MTPSVYQSTRLPPGCIVILMPGWPPRAWNQIGEYLCIADAGSAGRNLIRARRALSEKTDS